MTWLNPWGWLWLGLAVPIVLLYVLRIRRRRVPVATTRFWEEILTESRPRAWWQRLRHLVSLLLHLLLLLLLAAAIADPLSPSQSRDRRLLVLLVDRSASMNAGVEGGESRFDQAIRLARRELDGLREHDEGMIISFADDVWVECGRTTHPGALVHALDGIQPSDRAGGAARALALAHRLHAPDRTKEIVVFTDEAYALNPHIPRIRLVGHDVANQGIVGLSAAARSERRSTYRILVRVGNFASDPRPVSATVRLDGQPIDGFSDELAAGEQKMFTVDRDLLEGGLIEIVLAGEDGLAADNVARLMLPPARPIRVAVVATEANWFLENALSAVPLVEVTRLAPGQPVSPDAYEIVVYDGVVPADLPPIHSLFLYPREPCGLWRMGDPLEDVLVSTMDEDTPLLRHTRFERVTIRAAHPILPVGGRTVLASFGAPLLHAWEGSDVRRAALTVDLSRSDLALRTAFPILVANLVHWQTGRSTGIFTALRPGEDDRFERVGVFETDGATHCVNLADAAESDLRRPEVESGPPPYRAGASRPWWRWLAMVALTLVTLEWVLHQRRWVE